MSTYFANFASTPIEIFPVVAKPNKAAQLVRAKDSGNTFWTDPKTIRVVSREEPKEEPKEIRIPKMFYTDKRKRLSPVPVIVRETRHHYVVLSDDPNLYELWADADHYASNIEYGLGIVSSARATAKAISPFVR